MSSAASRSELLAARDRRHALLTEVLAASSPSTLFFSLNIPGEEKIPAGADLLFAWGMQSLREGFPDLRLAHRGSDRLGPFAVLLTASPPAAVKERSIALEESTPAGRLLDVDVYDCAGNAVGRAELGFPPRPCLLCPQGAADCMRLARHDYRLLKSRIDELLRPFRS